jgi:hypothetical protein
MKFIRLLPGNRSAAFAACVLGIQFSIIQTSSAGTGPSAATVADVQCLVIGMRFASSLDQRQKLSGTMLTIYFLGRIDGRNPTVNLEGLLVQQVKKMNDSAPKSAATRCGAELSTKGVEITRIGRALEELGRDRKLN